MDRDQGIFSLQLSRGRWKELDPLFKKSSEIFILACGSSYHAALFAKYFFEAVKSVKVSVEIASEFIYRNVFIPQDSLVFFISQSGETADILTAFKQIKSRGFKTLSFCNVVNSNLERQTDFSFHLSAGPEIAVASTKTFSSSLIALSLFAFHIAKLKKMLTLRSEKQLIKKLLALPSDIQKTLDNDSFFLKIMETLKSFKSFFYLGRGLYYPLALEGALKLKEIAYLHAEAYPFGEMKHGPLALIDKNSAVLALIPDEGILYQKKPD